MKRRNFLGLSAAVLAAPTVLAKDKQTYDGTHIPRKRIKICRPAIHAPLFGELTNVWFAGLAEKDFRLCALYVKRGTKTLMSFGTSNARGARTFWNAGLDGGLIFPGKETPIIEVVGSNIEWGYCMKRSDGWDLSAASQDNNNPFMVYWGGPC